MSEQNLSADGLTYSYTKCAVFLGLKDDEQSGVTTIITGKWMLVMQLTNNYMETYNTQYPVFLDGFAFTGLAQLQEVIEEWPATSGQNKTCQKKVFESMQKQCASFDQNTGAEAE